MTGPFAGSSPALGTIQLSREVYSRARRRYRPDKVSLLFIAESPPSSGGYFYFDKTIGKDHLFRETMKALEIWPLNQPMTRGLDKRPLLREFRSMGLYLIDTCEIPVDKLGRTARRLAITQGVASLSQRVNELDPGHVVLLKKTVFEPARAVLRREGLGDKILNNRPLPFPSHGNQTKYRTILRRLMRRMNKP